MSDVAEDTSPTTTETANQFAEQSRKRLEKSKTLKRRLLLGVRIADFGVDTPVAAEGPYLQFGDGDTTAEVDFDVNYIAFDVSGAFEPQLCTVDFDDLKAFCEHWLEAAPGCHADLDGSGRVDMIDYAILADNWLAVCPDDWPLQ